MTNPLTNPEELPLSSTGVSLTASDAERIATAIEAELAPSTRRTYAVGGASGRAGVGGEAWIRGRPLPRPWPRS